MFLEQLIRTLRIEEPSTPLESREVSGPSGGANARALGDRHGRGASTAELLLHGFTVDQVVHDYGDLCQAITELAFEQDAQ